VVKFRVDNGGAGDGNVRQLRSNSQHLTFDKSLQWGEEVKCNKIFNSNLHLRTQALPWTTSDATFLLPALRKTSLSLNQRGIFVDLEHENGILNSQFYDKSLNLWAELNPWTIPDAIFLLPVPRKSSPDVHSLSQWRIIFFLATTHCVRFLYRNIDLRARPFQLTTKDAIFLLPVQRKTEPEVERWRQILSNVMVIPGDSRIYRIHWLCTFGDDFRSTWSRKMASGIVQGFSSARRFKDLS